MDSTDQMLSLNCKIGNIIRLVYIDVDPKHEDDFNQWYKFEYKLILVKTIGVKWIYRGISLMKEREKYFFLHIFKNLDVISLDQYKMRDLTNESLKTHSYIKRCEVRDYEVILGGSILTNLIRPNIIRIVQVNVDPAHEADFNAWYNDEHVPLLKKVAGVLEIWRAINLGEKGQKYISVLFHENINVQQKEEYKETSQTKWLKSILPHLKDLSSSNYQIQD